MRKAFSWGAALAAVVLSTVIALPANAIIGGTAASEAGPNVLVAPTGRACTGTLISPQWMISAWHCFLDGGSSGRIWWGDTRRNQGQETSFSQVEHENDLALVRLDTELPPDAVKFPQLADADPQPGDTVEFFGFGLDDSGQVSPVLRTGSAEVKPSPDLDNKGGPAWTVRENGNGDVEGGDSGGGAYLDGKLAGVISTNGGNETTFASVAAHREFIDKTIKD